MIWALFYIQEGDCINNSFAVRPRIHFSKKLGQWHSKRGFNSLTVTSVLNWLRYILYIYKCFQKWLFQMTHDPCTRTCTCYLVISKLFLKLLIKLNCINGATHEKERGQQPKLTCLCAWFCSSVVRATAAKAGGPGFDSRPRIHFSMNGGLVSRQTRVQIPDSYICAKFVDFALSAIEKWYAISMKLCLTK